MKTYITKNSEETEKLGRSLARSIKPPAIIALESDLGGGKTTLVKGLAKGLGIKENVVSPTFVLERIYRIPKRPYSLYHYDLYRIKPDDILVDEILENAKDNVVAIEWAEKIAKKLPKIAIRVRIYSLREQDKRKIAIKGPTG